MFISIRALPLGLLLLAAIAAAEPPGVSAAPPWQPFLSSQGRFEVLIPGVPTRAIASELTPVGRIRGVSFWFDQGPSAFGVELRDLPKIAVKLLSPGTILERAKKSLLSDSGGDEVSSRVFDDHGVPGREVEYLLDGGTKLERARLLLVGSRLYIVAAARPADGPAGPVNRFLGSFKFWEKAEADGG